MPEKREKRCETCAAWDPLKNNAIGWEGFGVCRVHSTTKGYDVPRQPTFCMADYIPLDMINGMPDADELLLRIQNNYTEIDAQRDRLNRLSDMIGDAEDKLSKRIGGLEDRIDSVKRRVQTVHLCTGSLVAGAEAIRRRLDTLEKCLLPNVTAMAFMDPSPDCMPPGDASALIQGDGPSHDVPHDSPCGCERCIRHMLGTRQCSLGIDNGGSAEPCKEGKYVGTRATRACDTCYHKAQLSCEGDQVLPCDAYREIAKDVGTQADGGDQ